MSSQYLRIEDSLGAAATDVRMREREGERGRRRGREEG